MDSTPLLPLELRWWILATSDWAPSMPLPQVSGFEVFITPVEDPGPSVTHLKYDQFDNWSSANVRLLALLAIPSGHSWSQEERNGDNYQR